MILCSKTKAEKRVKLKLELPNDMVSSSFVLCFISKICRAWFLEYYKEVNKSKVIMFENSPEETMELCCSYGKGFLQKLLV